MITTILLAKKIYNRCHSMYIWWQAAR